MIQDDAVNAEKMLMSLTVVLRYSLERSKNEKLSLKEKLVVNRFYIDLIKIQFEERLKFLLDIPEPLLDCYLPQWLFK
ncbi:MAG: two-component system LytT family sensor kinase [Arenicella sp.]|jgi:two-component system LytT family sensor kinase